MNKIIFRSGFTIVEVLVTIVIIGTLAMIAFVSYSGVVNRARSTSLSSDLNKAYDKLNLFKLDYGRFPDTVNCANPESSTNICLEFTSGNSFTYTSNNYTGTWKYGLSVRNSVNSSRITSDSKAAIDCPYNFIVVPGSATYGTEKFCIMKYEARAYDGSTPISQAEGLPWSWIDQYDAIDKSPNVAGCDNCHLTTEAEWLTIAQNVMSVDSNWTGGEVGNGRIFSGHSDESPSGAQEALSYDYDGYYNTNNSYPSYQRRTLTLTNGEVIWDFAGNLWEWTSGRTTGGQPGLTGESGWAWKEWNTVTAPGSLSPNASPAFADSAASAWTSESNGIGFLYSYIGDATQRAFNRGGCSENYDYSGIFALRLNSTPGETDSIIGFRVAASAD